MAEREHRASKAGKTGITEHNEQCTRIQKGSDMTDEDKRDLNNRIAFYEWKDLQQACEEVEEQLDAALGAYWPHLIIPKPRLALSSYSTARSFAFAKSISGSPSQFGYSWEEYVNDPEVFRREVF